MRIDIDSSATSKVALVRDCPEQMISSAQDALDLLIDVSHGAGCDKLVIGKDAFAPEMFDLGTGLLGEVFQKYVNYHMKMAIVGDFSAYDRRSLADLIRESNRGNQFLFSKTEDEALAALHDIQQND